MAAPTATEIRNILEGYGITTSVLSDSWINDCRDNDVIPHVNETTRMNFSAEQTVTEYYSGNGTDILILNRRPVNEITDISYVKSLVSGNFLNSIELIEDKGILKAKTDFAEGSYLPVFAKGNNNIKVTYKYGMDDYPDDVFRAVEYLVCAKMLNLIGARTGGGSVQVQSHGRNYGNNGKYTDIRKEFILSAYQILRKYMTYVVGS